MLVDLQNVPEDGLEISRTVSPTELTADSRTFQLADDAVIRGKLARSDATTFRLVGHLDAPLDVTCVRCLESFRVDVREELDLVYLPQEQNVAHEGEEERELLDEELAVSFYRDEHIDLSHMVLEQVVLTLPMKPVCTADCKGLCPECGTNRNESSCACVRDTTDPRWDSLRNLLGS